ncbi:MAG TPA: exodeoxyribonuclease X, partial [Candidatus Bathyarchaeia archaeon]
NAAFDRRFMDFGECPWACTYKLAMVVYPNAPSHKNQVLRYFLNLQKLVHANAVFAHRALYDSEVTTYLFQHLLGRATSEEPLEGMLKVSNNPILLKKCRFGKHKDKLWQDVPKDYLDYIINKSSGWDEDTLYTAKHYYQR